MLTLDELKGIAYTARARYYDLNEEEDIELFIEILCEVFEEDDW